MVDSSSILLPNLDGTMFELEGFRLIWLAHLPFRPIPTADGLRTSETRISLPNGTEALCEMKSVAKSLKIVSAVKDAFRRASGQLSDDKCGILFLNLPPEWIRDVPTFLQLESLVASELRNRINFTEVVYYTRPFDTLRAIYLGKTNFMEKMNNKSPFATDLQGGLLKEIEQKTIGNTGWVGFRLFESYERVLELVEANTRPPEGHGS